MSTVAAIIQRGTRGAQPVATAVSVGTLYCVTDESNLVERSNGAAWQSYSPSGAGTGTVTNTGTITDHALVVGNGGVDVSALASLGTTTTVLHGNASGDPTFGAVALETDVSGDLPFANLAQGSALSVLGVTGNATADNASIVAANDKEVLRRNGTSVGFGAIDLSSSAAVTGVMAASHLPVGSQIQVVNTEPGTSATGTTTIPFDDTIPQSSEGTEFMTLAITPTSATNKLKIEVIFYCTNSASVHEIVALFQDSGNDALAAVSTYIDSATGTVTIPLIHYMTAGTTSSTTFKVRAGGHSAGTTRINGQSGVGRLFGGVAASSITITEIAA